MTKDVQLILERLQPFFKQRSQTRYWLQITDNHYGQTYNVFFNYQRKWHRLKSQPLHTLNTYNLADLEAIVTELQTLTKLTIDYVGFGEQVWPNRQQRIQRKPHGYE
ncbi:acetyl-CoA carboxylase [Lactiplantibacillus mudanjiangensis]|uniref:Acetyl-CoA carboxylase [Lactobacillus paracollinoides] n=1 Tax=Lactiplantibacillus mudanjiangensis TaxID=1296538 RepID=A0A660E0N4_9LACO|nr:acetyl-CoA carboxylase [Lactiplantibacillus mudanjiangensis]VDG19439.1 acetyl-CoA carboxylase [Lactobacillus paracollinoides] [Lactiplantibacillus mudanjiangensis]VDG24991.1 acetyl-CoA carboxylase [Lactobacillus paracollinoides] [Lactiplantibacillus mudanjiangensis]VDG27981.1 acetyl-CoA carboxylase [Lactobacillus paracollinoides] [Lactiplantibacillus mudanjiangensis]VDG30892.1 acetyl-CoA carboxylase [Lactobacillus paracollinoides] [Lactiplantibacillus mudanjiangensis]